MEKQFVARGRKTAPSGYVIYDGPSLLTGDSIVCIATLHSTNRKTGDMIQTWILLADRDPIAGSRSGADRAICGDCPSRGIAKPGAESGLAAERSCYVDLARAPLGIWNAWRRGRYPRAIDAGFGYASDHEALVALGRGRKVRLGAYGDPAALPSYVNSSLISAADGHTAYSHQIAWDGATGFDAGRMMVSADSLAAALAAWESGARTFRVVGDVSEVVRGREILCPASEEAGKRTQCADCLLCGGSQVRAKSIAIVAHGAGRKHQRSQQPRSVVMKHTYEGDTYRVLPHRNILDSSMYSVITGERVSNHFEHVPCGMLLSLDRDILDANWCPHCAATINQAAKRRANADAVRPS